MHILIASAADFLFWGRVSAAGRLENQEDHEIHQQENGVGTADACKCR